MLLLSSVLVTLLALASGTPLVLVDSNRAYVRPGAEEVFDQSAVGALTAGLTGLLPPAAVDAKLSHQLESLLVASPLRHPSALMAVTVGGLSAEAVSAVFSGRGARTLSLQGKGCPAQAMVAGLASVAAANPSAKMILVDESGVQNCDGSCLDAHLKGAAEVCSVQVTGELSGAGSLQLDGGETLDLSQQEDKLFAVELAVVYAGLKQQMEAAAQRAALHVQQEDVDLVQFSFMGVNALANKYGRDSTVVAAATQTVVRLLSWAVKGLDEAYAGDIVYEVAVLAKGPARVETVSQLVAWKEHSRSLLTQAARRQLQTTSSFPPADQTAAAKSFSSKAAAYGAFIVLLYFLMAGVWCMCYMPFKKDTLLYGSKKDQ